MAIPSVPLNIDPRGYAGSLVRSTAPSTGLVESPYRRLIEEAARMRQAIQGAQLRAIQEDLKQSRERFGFEKGARERQAQREMQPIPLEQDRTNYGEMAEALLSSPRAYREPDDKRKLAAMLRFIGPEATHRGLMQTGGLFASQGSGGMYEGGPPKRGNYYGAFSGNPTTVEEEPFRMGDLSQVRSGMRGVPQARPSNIRKKSYTNADLIGLEKGSLPGTVPETGPAKLHKGEVVLSADQVDEDLLYFLLRDKLEKLHSGQMDGKGTGKGYRKGSLPSYQTGSGAEDMLRALDPEERRQIEDYLSQAEGELRTQMAAPPTRPRKPPKSPEPPPPIDRRDIRRSDALRRQLVEEPLEGLSEFDRMQPHSLVPTGERYAQDALVPRSPLASRTGRGASVGSGPVRVNVSGKGGLLGAGEGGSGALIQRLEKAAASPGGREAIETLAKNSRSPQMKKLLFGVLAATVAAYGVSEMLGGDEEVSGDILGPSTRGAPSVPPPPEIPGLGFPGEDFLTTVTEPFVKVGEDIQRTFTGGEEEGAPDEASKELPRNLQRLIDWWNSPEAETELTPQAPPSDPSGAPPENLLDSLLSQVTEQAEGARKEEREGPPTRDVQRRTDDLASLSKESNRLWQHLQDNVDSMSDEQYKLYLAKAQRLDQLADRIYKRADSQRKRTEDVRDQMEEALQRTREARMQRQVETEKYQTDVVQKESVNLREKVQSLERDLGKAEPDSDEWNSFAGLLAQAHEEIGRLNGDLEVDREGNITVRETGMTFSPEEFRQAISEKYKELTASGGLF